MLGILTVELRTEQLYWKQSIQIIVIDFPIDELRIEVYENYMNRINKLGNFIVELGIIKVNGKNLIKSPR